MATNIILLGNTSVGKTTLLSSFIEGKFVESTVSTIGIDSKLVKKENIYFKVNYILSKYSTLTHVGLINLIQFSLIILKTEMLFC